jgi:prepilin-type processing-associated H-X9-DG protein
MKPTKLMNQLHKRIKAFTLIELAVVLGVLALFGAMVLPAMARARGTSSRIACADNLKQIGVAFNSWKVNHFGLYPMTVLAGAGGPPGSAAGQTIAASANSAVVVSGSQGAAGVTYAVFGVMSNELSTPKICVCPSDERTAHSNFTMSVTGTAGSLVAQSSTIGGSDPNPLYFNNFKLSYFLGVNAQASSPQMILAGDRNIQGWYNNSTSPANVNGYGNQNSAECAMGTNWVSGSTYPAWSSTKMHQSRGNVLLADGSVQQFNSSQLRSQCARSGDVTFTPGPNTLLFP